MEQYITFLGNHPILSTVWIVLAGLLIFGTLKAQFSPIKSISPQQLTLLVNRENAVVVDIRAEKEFKTSRIIDAKHLPNEKINKNDFASLEKFKDTPIIVVCNAGMTANPAAAKMFKAGFSKVSVLQGGMSAWQGAGLPVVKK